MKKFIIFIFLLSNFITFLNASEQLIVVITDDFNTSTAQLKRYEKKNNLFIQIGNAITVNLGRNGLGWGIGNQPIAHLENDPQKHEGDGKAPAGIFTLGPVFGYKDTLATNMPYIQASNDLICIDDSRSAHYNQLKKIRPDIEFNSFEWMRRSDNFYEIGLTVHHNTHAIAYRGSCIFFHVEKAPGSATAGCTSMQYDHLKTLLSWLDPKRNPLLIQIPASYCSEVEKQFQGICN
ncbi:MAG: hypothetical protein DRG24_03655 [Epsilonproteobacteria bacterium]|nr:MAG: hypothetical protein DRG24_03655 [Campylobacterota bacterium]